MRRLVVASTALLAMLAAAVVAVYLLFVGGAGDRLARAVPEDAAVYAQVYLQPSGGQKANLAGLIGRLPGFADAAALDDKLQQIAQRLLGGADIDYAADVRPWLGTEIAIAASRSDLLLVAAVRDGHAAQAAVPRLMAAGNATYQSTPYRGIGLMLGKGRSYALLPDLLIVAQSPARLRAAIDAETNARPSLADSSAFLAAMDALPVDRLASAYVDLRRALPIGERGIAGYQTAAIAVTAAADGLHADGSAAFSTSSASHDARRAFSLAGKPSTLAEWIPRAAIAELTVFGLQETIAELEAQLAADPAFFDATDALNQLRALAAVGLGINADRDLLPLFGDKTAVTLLGGRLLAPQAVLLARPPDATAAQKSLDRIRSALAGRGARVETTTVQGITITSVAVPEVGQIAWASSDGVVLIGLNAADVTAAIEAHASKETLASDPRYTAPFKIMRDHIGQEFWADVPQLVDAAAGIFDPGTELRDILHQIGQVAVVASAGKDQLEIHAVLTVR